MKIQKYCATLLLCYLTCLSIISFAENNNAIDLSKAVFDNKNTYKLDGLWHLYWQEFIVNPSESTSKPFLTKVPGAWDKDTLNSPSLSHWGFGTFYTSVHLPVDRPEKIAIKIRRVKMAHKLYINGQLISQVGAPGTSKETSKFGHKPDIAVFELPPGETQLDIALHVANFDYPRGGLTQSIRIGSYDAIYERRTKQVAKEFALFGALLIISLYYFVLWLKRRNDYSTFYFGLFCFGIAWRQLVTGEKFLLSFFPNIEAPAMLAMEYASIFCSISILHCFVSKVFPEEFYKRFYHLSLSILALQIVLSCTLPLYWQALLIPYYEVYALFIFFHISYVGVIAAKHGRQGAILFLIGISLVIGLSINDILYERGIIKSVFTFRWGAMLFVFIQASMLSIRFYNAFTELEILKMSLEEKVLYRTKELEQARNYTQQLMDDNRRLNNHTTQILEDERKLIAREIHDSFNSTLITIKLHLETIMRVTKDKEVSDIAKSLSGVISDKYELARNLVRRLRPEILDTLGLGGAITALIDTLNISGEITFSCDFDGDLSKINEDLTLAIYRIVQEATTNTVKYSQASSSDIRLQVCDKIVLKITDDGVGFDDKALREGVGLISIRERVVSFNGDFKVESKPGMGTRLSILIPFQS